MKQWKHFQNRIDFLQNEVASKDTIIKMLLEMQTENLDSGTNCTSSDKDKITSINITHDLFIPVNNLTHKVMTKTRKKEGKTGKKQNQKMQI